MTPRRQDGFVLVVVLGVLALLTVLVLGFSHRALLERRAAAVSLDHAEAAIAARGAAHRGIAFLRNQVAVETYSPIRQHVGRGMFWRDHKPMSAEGIVDIAPGSGDTVDYIIEDLDGRLSLNQAPIELLQEIRFLDFQSVNAILRRRGVGVVDQKPQPFLAVEELRALEDFSDDEWYGDEDEPGLSDMLTAWGDVRVNLNTAPLEVLNLVPYGDERVAQALVDFRRGPDGVDGTSDDRGFRNFEEIPELTGLSSDDLAPFLPYCKLTSQFFTITGLATRRQGKVRASCTATVEVREGEVVVLQWGESLGS